MRSHNATPVMPVLVSVLVLALGASPAWARRCVFEEVQKLTASDAAEDHRLGASVSVNGNLAVVGAWNADHGGIATGAAYVFRRDDDCTPTGPGDDCWYEEDKLVATDAARGDLFGWSVSISGDRVIVGARFHAVSSRSGAAYVFRRDDNDTPSDPSDDFWAQEDLLISEDSARDDDVGLAVSISGDRAVIGAPKNDDACIDDPDCNSGSAYVFRRDDNGTPQDPGDDFWIEEAKLTAFDAALGDNFGFSVSIDGDLAVIGAWHDDDNGDDSGSAYVFNLDDNGTPLDPSDDVWIDGGKLVASDTAWMDNFGVAVSISGDRTVIGAWLDDDDGNLSGSAYVFRRDDNETPSDPNDDLWIEEYKLRAADGAAGDELGKSVSIDGDRIAVGAFEDDDACADDIEPDPHCDSGAAYVFMHSDNGTPSDPSDDSWVQTAKLIASDGDAGDFFGRVGISGDHVITGSLDDAAGERAGAVYVYTVAHACANLTDVAKFQLCVTGDGGGVPFGCEFFDLDGDIDVDLEDYGRFLRMFSGP